MKYDWKEKIESSFCFVSLFNGMSTFVGYLVPKPSLEKNSSIIIETIAGKMQNEIDEIVGFTVYRHMGYFMVNSV